MSEPEIKALEGSQETCCSLEHQGQTKPDNDSWNHNDDEGRELTCQITIGVSFFLVFLLCLIIACCVTSKGLKAFFFLLTIAALAVFIAFSVQVGQKVQSKPIVVAYALSQYVTKSCRTNPRLNPDDVFPEHVEFETKFPEIQKEVMLLAQQEDVWPLTKTTFGGANSGIGTDIQIDEKTGKETGWRIFMVSVGEKFTPRAEELLPTLTSLVRKHNGKMVSCAISMLPPHVCIPPHVGYAKSVIRYMLPLEVPKEEGCFLCLNGEAYKWEQGKSFCFDDCFPHSVRNDTSERRIVVYCDILREVHSKPVLTKISKFVFQNFVQNSQAVKDELARTEYLVSSVAAK